MGKKLKCIIAFLAGLLLLFVLIFVYHLRKVDPLTTWKSINNFDYSIKYPSDWMVSDASKDGGVIYLSNFKTDSCKDEEGNPINVLKNNICVAIAVSQQVSGLENMPIAQYLNRQFGKYNSEAKDYETVVYDEETISGHSAYRLRINNSLNYIIRQGSTIFQISMTPEDSQQADQFKSMLSTLELFSTQ